MRKYKGDEGMRLNQYNEIIQLFNTILVMAIPILCLYMFKIIKEIRFIIISIIFFVEMVCEVMVLKKITNIIPNIQDMLLLLLIFKLMTIYYIEVRFNRGIFRYLGSILSTLGIIYMLKFSSLNFIKVYNIGLNLILLNVTCLLPIKNNYKDISKYKNKLVANKKYIKKISNELECEIRTEGYLKEDIKLINYKLVNVVEAINTPIIMINSKKECVMKNKFFDDFLKENNFYNDFSSENFLNEISNISKKDLSAFLEKNNLEENSLTIDLNSRKYKFVILKDFIDDEKITIFQIKDITDICKKEEKLRQSELRYKTLMDILSDGVIIHDGNTVNYINNIAMEILGVDSSNNNLLAIDNLQSLISKKSKDEFQHNIVSVGTGLKSDKVSKLELENGKIINFTSCSFNMNNKKMILSIVNDFTDHQIALDKLKENRKTYSTLIQTLPDGIALINKYTKEQVYINKYMMRILQEMGIDKFYKIIDDYIKDGEYGNFKTFNINTEKNRKISIAIEQIPKQDNLLIVVRDLETEQQRENIYNTLQGIKERNKFKSEFLSRISSNLKRPITTIYEVNKLLESNQDIYNYPGVNSYIKNVKQNSYRLKRILSNIEEISKIEAGMYDRDYKAYDLVKYVESIIESCEEYINRKGLTLNFNSDRREVFVYMDKNKIEKIILNILSNALKFTEKGGKISMTINVDNNDVIIGIEDNGFGIPSNKLDIIFENFEQVNRSLSRTAEGTGVGLYLVKKLALVHHAKIKVNSKIGQGSKFEIILKDNFLESTKDNRKKIEDIIIDKESIDIEFSDIYLEY